MVRAPNKSNSALANTAFNKKYKLFFSKKLQLNIKKRLIRTYVWNVAAYGSETWGHKQCGKEKT